MKKLISAILAFLLVIPCIFGLNSCGDPDAGSLEPWEILEDEWKLTISADRGFKIRSSTINDLLSDGDLIELEYDVSTAQGLTVIRYDVTVKDSSSDNGVAFTTYLDQPIHQPDGPVDKYYRVTIDEYGEEDVPLEITEDEFYAAVIDYINIIEYVSEHYAAFESESFYTLDLNTVSTTLDPSLGFTSLTVERNSFDNSIQLNLYKNDRPWAVSFESPLAEAYANTTKFVIKGGPSETDPDYAEYYFDGDNGFRIYSPNNTIAERTDGYYKKNGDSYDFYVKMPDGSWQVTPASAYNFNTVIESTKAQYLGFMDKIESLSLIEEREGENSAYVYGYVASDGEFTVDIGGFTYHYYDIKILSYINETGHVPYVYSITWKMKITQGEASSLEYNMTMSTVDAEITYPTVN